MVFLSLISCKVEDQVVYTTIRNDDIDTLSGVNYRQIVKYRDGLIESIRIEKISSINFMKDTVGFISEDISFNKNGFVDSLYFFHGKKLIPNDGFIEVGYQRSYLYLDSIGNINDFEFTEDFFSKYSRW